MCTMFDQNLIDLSQFSIAYIPALYGLISRLL